MKKVDIALPKARSIEINGHKFEIIVDDADILESAIKMQGYADIPKGDDAEILKAIREAISFIDEMLGAGATRKISEGRPVGINWIVETMQIIAIAIIEEYQSDVAAEYE